jgi:excisionase family DNA binding protein
MTTGEAAERLELTTAVLRRKAAKGKLGAVKRGRQWFFPREEIERYALSVAGKNLNDPTRGRDP